jgi:RNA polymerase sigma-70 factor, ECF subfamily
MVASDDMIQCQQGGREAFESVIRENQGMIHALCYRLTGSMDEADDLAQETFLQAYRHYSLFRGESKVSSWLYRIAVNRCLNWRRQRERQDRLHQDWSQEGTLANHDGHTWKSAQIQDALLKLPPKQRAAVVLTTYDGMSHAEAAQVLGCTEATVSWRLFAARTKLKRWLKRLHQARTEEEAYE